jgi:periplasmic protein TonB
MKRRFALPVVIALSTEAVLLLGFNRPGVASAEPSPRVITLRNPPPVEEPEPVATADESAPGSPDARPALPSIPEPPAAPTRDAIPEVTSPAVPQPAISPDRIPPGIAGPAPGPGSGGNGIIPAGMLDNPPHASFQRAPIYPYEAARDQRSGEVLVEFSVDESGHVFNPVIVRSSDRVFEEPTLRAVVQWRFEPGRRDGRAVRFRMRLPVEYHPDGS